MAKFLKLDTSGVYIENSTIAASAGVADADKVVATNTIGEVDITFLPAAVKNTVILTTAAEALTGGNLVYISSTGAFKADAVNLKLAMGFVLAGSALSAAATVFTSGVVTGQTGLTVGARYYLSDTVPGTITAVMPTTAGKIAQIVGIAVSTTSIAFELGSATIR